VSYLFNHSEKIENNWKTAIMGEFLVKFGQNPISGFGEDYVDVKMLTDTRHTQRQVK